MSSYPRLSLLLFVTSHPLPFLFLCFSNSLLLLRLHLLWNSCHYPDGHGEKSFVGKNLLTGGGPEKAKQNCFLSRTDSQRQPNVAESCNLEDSDQIACSERLQTAAAHKVPETPVTNDGCYPQLRWGSVFSLPLQSKVMMCFYKLLVKKSSTPLVPNPLILPPRTSQWQKGGTPNLWLNFPNVEQHHLDQHIFNLTFSKTFAI